MDTTTVASEAKTWVDFAFYAIDFLKYLIPTLLAWAAPSPFFNKMKNPLRKAE